MSKNLKQTRIGGLASSVLRDSGSSALARALAGSALSQVGTDKQTGAKMEHVVSAVLRGKQYSPDTKALAAALLSQSNKERK